MSIVTLRQKNKKKQTARFPVSDRSFLPLNLDRQLRRARKVDSQGLVSQGEAVGRLLELTVCLALLVVVLHIGLAGKLAFGHDGVALRPGVGGCRACAEGQDVRLAILMRKVKIFLSIN